MLWRPRTAAQGSRIACNFIIYSKSFFPRNRCTHQSSCLQKLVVVVQTFRRLGFSYLWTCLWLRLRWLLLFNSRIGWIGFISILTRIAMFSVSHSENHFWRPKRKGHRRVKLLLRCEIGETCSHCCYLASDVVAFWSAKEVIHPLRSLPSSCKVAMVVKFPDVVASLR